MRERLLPSAGRLRSDATLEARGARAAGRSRRVVPARRTARAVPAPRRAARRARFRSRPERALCDDGSRDVGEPRFVRADDRQARLVGLRGERRREQLVGRRTELRLADPIHDQTRRVFPLDGAALGRGPIAEQSFGSIAELGVVDVGRAHRSSLVARVRSRTPELLPRFVDPPGDRAFRAPEHLTCFSVAQSVDGDQHQRRSQGFAQRIDALAQSERELAVRRLPRGVRKIRAVAPRAAPRCAGRPSCRRSAPSSRERIAFSDRFTVIR